MDDGPHPIPGRLNASLVVLVAGVMVASLIYLGTSAGVGPGFWIATVLYALGFLCNYSLLHEACHDKLHARPALNRLLGTTSATLFPIAFSLIHETHRGHHARNRSDEEMFDLYREGEAVLPKRVRWYALLLGGHYVAMVLSSLAILLVPPGLIRRLLARDFNYGPYLEELLAPGNVRRIRWETMLIMAGVCAVVVFLDVARILPAVLLGVVLWSTNQYLAHVFSPRDRVEGAFNLTGAGILGWVLLHREHDLTHHRDPQLPWIYLPSQRRDSDERLNYFRQWVRQWSAPRLIDERGEGPEDGEGGAVDAPGGSKGRTDRSRGQVAPRKPGID